MSISLESLVSLPVSTEKPASVGLQLISFIMVGTVAALTFVVLSSVMIGLHTGLADWVMSALCYAAFVVPVYLAHRRFSFRSGAPHTRALPRYVVTQGTALALASLFSYVAYGIFGLPTLIAALLVVGLTSGVNFMVLRAWAFASGETS